jgi:hypothetical protein
MNQRNIISHTNVPSATSLLEPQILHMGWNSYICCVLFTDYRTMGSTVLECLAVAECSIAHLIKSVNVIMNSDGKPHRHHYELITILLPFLNTNALQRCLICTPQSVLESKISPQNQCSQKDFCYQFPDMVSG